MSTIDTFTWESLPCRHSTTVAAHTITPKDEPPTKKTKTDTQSYNTGAKPRAVTAAKFDDIVKSIAERSSQHKIPGVTSLESKDGCAGENFEYLDHTADVQFHCWGKTMVEAFERMGPCFGNYVTDLTKVEIDERENIDIEVSGHDLQSLLYNYMNEMLFKFTSDYFCICQVKIHKFDLEKFTLAATLLGDIFDATKHACGTEVKAITYSNMQIHETPEKAELYVIVDI